MCYFLDNFFPSVFCSLLLEFLLIRGIVPLGFIFSLMFCLLSLFLFVLISPRFLQLYHLTFYLFILISEVLKNFLSSEYPSEETVTWLNWAELGT